MKFDDILHRYFGKFGPYQALQFFLLAVPCALVAAESMSWTFTGADIAHRCLLKGERKGDLPFDVLNGSGPGQWSKLLECQRPINLTVAMVNSTPEADELALLNRTRKEACLDGYLWWHSDVQYSGLERWSTVCSGTWIKSFIQSTYYIGQLIGAIALGYFADRYGRKICFILAVILRGVASVLMAVVPYWEIFAVLRCVAGFCHAGTFALSVVIGMEMVPPKYRMVATTASGLFFSFGEILLGLLAYGLRDYRYLQLTIALPSLLCAGYYWLIPESPRWLVSKQRYEEADKILKIASKINKSETVPDQWWTLLDETEAPPQEKVEKKNFTYLDLVKTPKIRCRLLISLVWWPVVSMVYYGISMNPTFYGGDRYMNFVLLALVEIPAAFAVAALINPFGRKLVLLLSYFLGGLALLLTLFVPKEEKVAFTVLQLIAKFAMSSAFAAVYVFTPELFPTTLRNMAIGLCSVAARFGSIGASYLALWLIEYSRITVVLIFCCSAFLASLLTFFQPETAGYQLCESIEEAEEFAQGRVLYRDFGGTLFRRRKNTDGDDVSTVTRRTSASPSAIEPENDIMSS